MADVSVAPRSSMTVDEICHELQYVRTGKRPGPNRDLIYQMVRDGTFPPPITDRIPVCRWRWSRTIVQHHIDGDIPAESDS
jgi:predicted DNA-binding transcriptional regulator AlpA